VRVTVQVATPESLSIARQPAAGPLAKYVAPARTPVTRTTGRTVSMLMPLTTTVAAPPSVAMMVRVTDWPGALRESLTGAGHALVSGALVCSQVKVIVTGVEYHPLRRAFALDTVAVMTGSMRAVEAEEPVKLGSPA
jgi:hypothetical protein